MVEVLVTGGAGFIGSNFVRHALQAHPDWRITTLDKLTYAGRMETLKDVIDDPRHRFVRGDVADPHVAAPLVHAADDRRPFCGRDARRSLDSRSRRVHQDRRDRHLRAARGGASRRTPALLRSDFDRRGLRQRAGGLERRDRRAEAAQPVLGEQGGRRSPRVQLLGHLRRARDGDAGVEQLRPVPVSREGHPALHHQRPRQHPGAALRRRPQHPRLAARDGSLPRPRRGDRAGDAWRGLQHRRRQRGAQRRSHAHAAAPGRTARLAHQAGAGSPGSRPALQPRHGEAPDARLAAAGAVRRRA